MQANRHEFSAIRRILRATCKEHKKQPLVLTAVNGYSVRTQEEEEPLNVSEVVCKEELLYYRIIIRTPYN